MVVKGPAPTLEALALRLISAITPCGHAGLQKVRVGNPNGDGGYVMIDDFDAIAGAISIGVGGDVSWDLDIANRGIDVFQYDHTVAGPPIAHSRFRFHKLGLGPADAHEFRSLDGMVADIPARGDLILKVDVEGAEWTALAAAHKRTLERFSQIVLEIHGPMSGTTSDRLRHLRMCRKLSRSHAVVHVHANNYAAIESFGRVLVPGVLEITYARRSNAPFVRSMELLPTALDVPNDPSRPEIPMSVILNPWAWVSARELDTHAP